MSTRSARRHAAAAVFTLGLLAVAGGESAWATSQQQPAPGGQFHEPAPPIPSSSPSPEIDPATGFAIDGYTRFLIHPETGYLIEPTTGQLLLPGSLIYTNLRYDWVSGEVTEMPDGGVPAEQPTPEPTPSETTAAPTPTPTPNPTPSPTPAAAPAPSVEAPVPSETPTPTRTPTPSATPSAEAQVAEPDRASSRTPLVWAVGALVLLAAAATVVVGIRRRAVR